MDGLFYVHVFLHLVFAACSLLLLPYYFHFLHAVALVTFESEIDSKDCRLGWQATVRTVIKGAELVPQTAVNILISVVRGCNAINFKRGEHYLVAGGLRTAGGIGVFVHDVSVGRTGQVIWDSTKYAPLFEQIEGACG